MPRIVTKTIDQLNTRITVGRIAVARLEFRPVTPIFASSAVSPAKKADANAQKSHSIGLNHSDERFGSFRCYSGPILRYFKTFIRTKRTRQHLQRWRIENNSG